VVLESAEEVMERVRQFRRSIFEGLIRCPARDGTESGPSPEQQRE
jgi:hypothetical protein